MSMKLLSKDPTMMKLTDKQRDAIDRAVLTAIRTHPQTPRAADIAQTPVVQKAISALPRRKEAFRYLDNSLQRLRKQGRIEATRGGHWRVVHCCGRP